MAETPISLTLESHEIVVNLADTPDLTAFALQANARARIAGLDDRLNPGIIDPAKLAGLVAALPAQAPEVRKAFSGHVLQLGAGFGVLAVEPTAADAFGPGYAITVERIAGSYVLAHANPAIDAAAARVTAVSAEAATMAADQAVQAAGADAADLGGLRWRRALAARGWHIAAEAWANAEPSGESAARAAEAALDRFDMPSGGRR